MPERRGADPSGRRRLLQGAAAALLVQAIRLPAPARADDAARDTFARAATAFLAALEPRQRRRALLPFSHDERRNWHYLPRRREGVPFKELSPPARTAAHALMKAGLSVVGYEKALNIMRLEEVLREIELLGFLRDPDNYSVTIFGPPDAQAPWGFRLEGHHLSLNYTIVPGRPVAVTPAFMGANPATVPTGPHQGLRTLREEQELGLALARAIEPSLRPRLVIAGRSFGDIVSGPGRGEDLRSPTGLALGELAADLRSLAMRLVETYALNMRAGIAEAELQKMREAGIERIHFAWAGPVDPTQPHYYRLHGPTLLIEYDNTQNDANHIHTVWHSPQNDFGADLLRAHYLSGHPHA
jgi:Protein of unknown function (DUF3500)